MSIAKNSLPEGYSEGTLRFRGSIGNIDHLELEGRDIEVHIHWKQLRLLEPAPSKDSLRYLRE